MFEKRKNFIKTIPGISEEEKELLYSALNMHGHICGGMPLGFKAGLAALKALNAKREPNMDKMVIVFSGERHAAGCFADGVQFATGCTFGKGLMKKEPKGKFSFLLIDKVNEKAVQVTIKPEVMLNAFKSPFVEMRKKGIKPTEIPEDLAQNMFKRPFSLKDEDLSIIKGPFDFSIPKGKSCFNLVTCEKCGDAVAENYIKLEDGKKVCIDCWSFKN